MDFLTFFAIIISVLPLQLMILSCLQWLRNKINLYEKIILDIVAAMSPAETYPQDPNVMRIRYAQIRRGLRGGNFPPVNRVTQTELPVLYGMIIKAEADQARREKWNNMMHIINEEYIEQANLWMDKHPTISNVLQDFLPEVYAYIERYNP